jgi:hypothetical protein
MAFTNLAKNKILNGQDSHGAGPGTSPMGDGYVFLKYAWSLKISDKDLASAPPLVAKTCELPRWSVETQIVNVYNHKTIVQTKLNYEPITMTFYDQVNGTAERLMWDYVKGQFDTTDGSKTPNFSPLTIEITMKDLSGDGLGDKVYTLKNAFITDAQHDTLDYATSDVILWTITVRYEDLEITGVKDLEFSGPTPVANTGIAALPKPPARPKPITKPPKADALKEIERGGRSSEFARTDPRRTDLSNWEKAGGTVTGGGAATGNPNLTKQAARARASAQKTQSTKPWPSGSSEVTYNAARDSQAANAPTSPAPTTVASPSSTTAYSPSTGTTSPAASNKQRESTPIKQSPKAQEFIKQEEAKIKNEGYSEEYKKAYIERLKATPMGDGPQSQYSARQHAQRMATRDAQMYPSQTRSVDNGVTTNKANLTGKEPSPPPVREGTTVVNQKTNDSKGEKIMSSQAQRESEEKKKVVKRGGDF